MGGRAGGGLLTVYLKQYGAERTATNYVRALVESNLRGATVLMHVLGDKHSPPADLAACHAAAQGAPDAALAFVTAATWSRPARTTDPDDAGQRDLLARLAPGVASAYAAGRLHFLVSVRDPCAWAGSILRWRGTAPDRPGAEAVLRAECERAARLLAGCRELAARHPGRVHVAVAEQVAADPGGWLATLADRTGLPRPAAQRDVRGIVLPAHWDGDPAAEHPVAWTPPAAPHLPPALRAVVDGYAGRLRC